VATAHVESGPVEVRALTRDDFEAVLALDRATSGALRRSYFDRRLAAALRQPRRHLQFAALEADRLAGFLLARVAGGEFGRPGVAVVLETIGVAPASQRRGVGARLLASLEVQARERAAVEVATQADWRDERMLGFLARTGFALAPRQLLERTVDRLPFLDEEGETPAHVVRALRAEDLDALRRIDRCLTGQDRGEYLQRQLDEVLHESALELSLVVEADGHVVGFVMARIDAGDFGRTASVASLDTIGVMPGFERQGLARGLVAQLVNNLLALRVERLETEVACSDFGLLGFLHRCGFAPSQRLAFRAPL
jgi:ribosomal protein S18 acetylase RimI-like enzyme